ACRIRRLPAKQLMEDCGERVLIRTRVDARVKLLWRSVRRDRLRELFRSGCVERLVHAEIAELYRRVVRQDDVGRPYLAVHEASLVRVMQRTGELHHDENPALERDRRCLASKLLERRTFR